MRMQLPLLLSLLLLCQARPTSLPTPPHPTHSGDLSEPRPTAELAAAMNETIRQLVQLKESVGITEPSSMNFCVTDGRSVVAARCRSHPGQDPPSLYYALGSSFMYSADTKSYSMDSASEPDTVINRPAVLLLL